MSTTVSAPSKVRNILYLTDFSEPSEAALSFATMLGRGYAAKVHALHVLMPAPFGYMTPGLTTVALEAKEENAQAEMQKVESGLAGLEHKTLVERGIEIWPAVRRAIEDDDVDLIVLGTHGRTGAEKLLLGSVAEETSGARPFRYSPSVPACAAASTTAAGSVACSSLQILVPSRSPERPTPSLSRRKTRLGCSYCLSCASPRLPMWMTRGSSRCLRPRPCTASTRSFQRTHT